MEPLKFWRRGFLSLGRGVRSLELPPTFDCILYNGEHDLYLLRLHELNPYISLFYVVESRLTFSGLKKDLKFPEHMKYFAEFKEKIK